MRCFIAIDITETLKAALVDLQEELAERLDIQRGDVKWVRPETMHLTLKFLGEIRDIDVVDVCRIVGEVAGRHEAFDIDVKEVGCFGGHSARVLWVGAGKDSAALLALQQDLEEQLAGGGWPREARKFSAHLTLCRVRNARAGVKLTQAMEQYKALDLGTMPGASLCVYESQLRPDGPMYTCLGDFTLR